MAELILLFVLDCRSNGGMLQNNKATKYYYTEYQVHIHLFVCNVSIEIYEFELGLVFYNRSYCSQLFWRIRKSVADA